MLLQSILRPAASRFSGLTIRAWRPEEFFVGEIKGFGPGADDDISDHHGGGSPGNKIKEVVWNLCVQETNC